MIYHAPNVKSNGTRKGSIHKVLITVKQYPPWHQVCRLGFYKETPKGPLVLKRRGPGQRIGMIILYLFFNYSSHIILLYQFQAHCIVIRHFCYLGSHRPDKSNTHLTPQLCDFYTFSYEFDPGLGFPACRGDEQGWVCEPSLACGGGSGLENWQESPTEGNSAAAFYTIPELVKTCGGSAAPGIC